MKRFRTPLYQRLLLWCVLMALVLIAGCLQVTQGRRLLQTNLLTLLPPTENSVVAEMAIQRLSSVTEKQTFFLIGHSQSDQAIEAATKFAELLRTSGFFPKVTVAFDGSQWQLLQQWIGQHRFRYMSDADRELLRAESAPEDFLLQRVQTKLFSPGLNPQALNFVDDPMGFADGWFNTLPLRAMKLVAQEGVLAVHEAGKTWVFVVASTQGSAFDHDLAQPTIKTIDDAQRAIGEVEVIRAGPIFHAEAARQKAQHDVDLIGAGSLLGMLGLLYWVFRSIRPLVGAMVTALGGVLAACVVCIAVYGELHLITLVFGASLIGEAVDYAIQYFAAHVDAGLGWHPLQELRRMASGLSVALATSLLGYGALWLSPFLAMSQMALFAMVGLSTAWLGVFLFMPWWMRRPSRHRFEGRAEMQRKWLHFWQTSMSPMSCFFIVVAVIVISVPGWLKIEAQDDVRLLMAADPAILQQELQLKSFTGLDQSSQFFLIEGSDENEVLTREEALRDLLAAPQHQEDLQSYQAVSLFVPSHALQNRAASAWDQFVFSPANRLQFVLSRAGVEAHVATDLREEWSRQGRTQLDVAHWLDQAVSAPWRHLWLGSTAHGYASVLLPMGLKPGVNFDQLAAQVPGVRWVDKATSVSHLFRDYRRTSGLWLVATCGLIFCLLAWRYGFKRAGAVLMPTCLAIVFSLGAYGWVGHVLTLFNMMALMLVLGIGVNYSIFLVEGGERSVVNFVGVQLSAATTLLSFGLLSFSSMPALSGFGLSLAFGIALAVLLAPMTLSLTPTVRTPT